MKSNGFDENCLLLEKRMECTWIPRSMSESSECLHSVMFSLYILYIYIYRSHLTVMILCLSTYIVLHNRSTNRDF